jgi:hypothetical protein
MNDSPTRSLAQSVIAAGEFGSVVAAQYSRVATPLNEAVEFLDQVVAGDVALYQTSETFTGVLIESRRS